MHVTCEQQKSAVDHTDIQLSICSVTGKDKREESGSHSTSLRLYILFCAVTDIIDVALHLCLAADKISQSTCLLVATVPCKQV